MLTMAKNTIMNINVGNLILQIDELRKKKALAEQEYRNSMPASSYQQQKLRVCEVCSAYLGIHDNDRRLADHFGGKLHLGFITIREKLSELKVTNIETFHLYLILVFCLYMLCFRKMLIKDARSVVLRNVNEVEVDVIT